MPRKDFKDKKRSSRYDNSAKSPVKRSYRQVIDKNKSGSDNNPDKKRQSQFNPGISRNDGNHVTVKKAVGDENKDDTLILKGRHEVLQALSNNHNIEAVYISTAVKGPIGGQLRDLASLSHIPVKDMNPELFGIKFGDKSQGVAAITGAFEYCELNSLLDRLENTKDDGRRVLVALNHVEDPRNLGAIVRTVEASGCDGVLIPKHRSAGMTEWAIRTAQGAASILPVVRVNNLGDTLEKLKDRGYWVIGLDGAAKKRYDQVSYNSNTVIVGGGENSGLGERVSRACDDLVAIPIAGKTPSLNVSISIAVALYEILRQKDFCIK